MDLVRMLGSTLEFSFLRHEHILRTPTLQRDQLQDGLLQLHGMAQGVPVPTGCDDIRIYFDNRDFTALVLNGLRRQLDGPKTDQFRGEYNAAMNEWLALEALHGAAYPSNNLAAERAKATELAAIQPLSRTLAKLGDPTAGWSGLLHIFNFLYSHVGLEPISMAALVQTWNATNAADPIDPRKLATITISSGPWRRLFPNAPQVGRGAVAIQMEFQYHNLLEDRVALLERRFDAFEHMIVDELESIADALGPDGPIQRHLSTLDASSTSVKRQLASVEQALASQDRQLAALATSTDELKRAVDKIQ